MPLQQDRDDLHRVGVEVARLQMIVHVLGLERDCIVVLCLTYLKLYLFTFIWVYKCLLVQNYILTLIISHIYLVILQISISSLSICGSCVNVKEQYWHSLVSFLPG